MSFARKLKRTLKRKNDESVKELRKEIRDAKRYVGVEVKRKFINLGTIKKKYEI